MIMWPGNSLPEGHFVTFLQLEIIIWRQNSHKNQFIWICCIISHLQKITCMALMLHFDFVRPANWQPIFRILSKKSFFKFKAPQIICHNLSYCRDISSNYISNPFLQAEKIRKLLDAKLLAVGLAKVSLKWPSRRP